MFNYYGAYRRTVKELREALKDRDTWRRRCEELQLKLDKRSDFFIEREFKLIDRFLTAKVNTYAITPEIKAQEIDQSAVTEEAWEAYRRDKIAQWTEWAKDAGEPNPEQRAAQDFERNLAMERAEFEAQTVRTF